MWEMICNRFVIFSVVIVATDVKSWNRKLFCSVDVRFSVSY